MSSATIPGVSADRTAAYPQGQAPLEMPVALTVQDLLTVLAARRSLLAKSAIAGAVVGLLLAFLLPTRFTAVTTILPPSSPSSLASAFASQEGLGGLASLAGNSFGFHNPADVCLAMLRSRSVEDAMINRFDLMREYHEKYISDTRKKLESNTSLKLNLKSGLIAVSAEDRDPARAAELANGYVDEFKRFSASLAITEAGQRRLFFDQQLLLARNSLATAEDALKKTQQSTGMLEPAGASKAILESVVATRAELAAKQVQLRSMRTYATEENPRLIQVKQEIAALESQVGALAGTSQDNATDPLLPSGQIPSAGAEYLRRTRDVKYNETVVALLSRQLEVAQLDEARQGAVIQVVDPAVVPDRRSSPKRLATLLACIAFSFCGACFWAAYQPRRVNWHTEHSAITIALLFFAIFIPGHAAAQETPGQAQSPDCSTGAVLSDSSCFDQNANSSPYRQVQSDDVPLENRPANSMTLNRQSHQTSKYSANESDPQRGTSPRRRNIPPPAEPQTEFEQMVADSAGRPLPVFGRSLFQQPPDTFALSGGTQVPSDYLLGPGDELRIRIWGQIDADLQIEVDRSGRIYIPHVGDVTVSGVRYSDLAGLLKRSVGQVYKNFDLDVAINHLHSIQIFVVGQAKSPGVYTISSLSTLVNAVFLSGGPAPQGSLRRIQIRRGDKPVQEFDLYDLLIRGDKTHDIRLQSGDVLFIPPVGPLVAISGSVQTAGIYELKGEETIATLIETAAGLNTVANSTSVTVERVSAIQARSVVQFPLNPSGLAFALQGGDIVHVSSVVPRFDDTITLRGYVTNPGRFPFRPGMHVRDLLPSAEALLPREYWLNRASTTDGRQTEYPVRKLTRETTHHNSDLNQSDQPASATALAPSEDSESTNKQPRQETIPEYYQDLAHSESILDPALRNNPPTRARPGIDPEPDTLTQDLRKLVPSVNWRYALIQRVDSGTLKTSLIPFDLGKAIVDQDPASNLSLQPGDIVTVFSQKDIVAPQHSQTRYIKIEGEVEHPGVYELAQGESLRDALTLAGGLTSNSYPYATRMTRESARVEQQKGLDQMLRTTEAAMRASTVNAAASQTQDAGGVNAHQNAQEALLASLRNIQASGRVVLAMAPEAHRVEDYPAINLEDGDRIVIPAQENTVTVSGAVYNPASFVYDARRKVSDYMEMAGKGGLNSNQHLAFVLRADGTVISRKEASGVFHGGFDNLPMHPGDQIVVPEKVDNGVLRAIHDWPQFLAPLALTALAVTAVAP